MNTGEEEKADNVDTKIRIKFVSSDNLGIFWESAELRKSFSEDSIKELDDFKTSLVLILNQPKSTLPDIISQSPEVDGVHEISILKSPVLPKFSHDMFIEIMNHLKTRTSLKCMVKISKIDETLQLFQIGVIFRIDELIKYCIVHITKSLTPYSLTMTFIISFYYNLPEIKLESFNHIRKYFYHTLGIADFSLDPLINKILNASDGSTIRLLNQNHLVLNIPNVDNLVLDTSLFKSMYKQHYTKIKKDYFFFEMKFTLSRVLRKKSPDLTQNITENIPINQSIHTEYPHYFTLADEELKKDFYYAKQEEPSSDIFIYLAKYGNSCEGLQYDENYCAHLEKNFWGTKWTLWDSGLEASQVIKLPDAFGHQRRPILEIIYQTNISGSKPRDFTVVLYEENGNIKDELIINPPEYNSQKDIYQLDFYGRAKVASSRNFQLISKKDVKRSTILLMHGKTSMNEFTLDYLFPMSKIASFAISLASISKKKLVQQNLI